jgi:hypothetical protein
VDVPAPPVVLAEARPVAALARDHPPDVPDAVEGIENPVEAELEAATNPVEAPVLAPVAGGMDHPAGEVLAVVAVPVLDEPTLDVEVPEAAVLPIELKLNVLKGKGIRRRGNYLPLEAPPVVVELT